jgi:hypothetical protein
MSSYRPRYPGKPVTIAGVRYASTDEAIASLRTWLRSKETGEPFHGADLDLARELYSRAGTEDYPEPISFMTTPQFNNSVELRFEHAPVAYKDGIRTHTAIGLKRAVLGAGSSVSATQPQRILRAAIQDQRDEAIAWHMVLMGGRCEICDQPIPPFEADYDHYPVDFVDLASTWLAAHPDVKWRPGARGAYVFAD